MAYSVDDKVRVTAVFKRSDTGEQINSFVVNIDNVGAGGDAGFRSDIQEWIDDLYSDVQSFISDVVSGDRIELDNLTSGVPDSPIAFDPAWVGGRTAEDPMPSAVSGLVLLRTGVSRIQGRKYLPSFGVGTLGTNHWAPTVITAMNAFGSKFLGSFTGAQGWEVHGLVPAPSVNGYFTPVSAAAVLVPAYQRRRKEGRGS